MSSNAGSASAGEVGARREQQQRNQEQTCTTVRPMRHQGFQNLSQAAMRMPNSRIAAATTMIQNIMLAFSLNSQAHVSQQALPNQPWAGRSRP